MPFNQQFNAVNLTVSNFESIKVGLSAEEAQQMFQAFQQMGKKDRQELDGYLAQIKEAKTDEEKKSLGRKAAVFIRDRGLSIFDSLITNGIILMAQGA